MSLDVARVLVVEDNRDTSALLRDLLEGEGYEVESVASGEAALDVLGQAPEFELLVLDLMLPGMSGYDVIEQLRARPEPVALPILVLSALSNTAARVRGLRDGADDFMTKPFLPEELVARARTLVTRRLLEHRTREIEALGQIAQAGLTAPTPETLRQRIVEIVAAAFAADAAAILLVDEARGELCARAAIGFGDDLAALSVPLSEGLGAQALAVREPVVIPDGASSDPRVTNPLLRPFRSLMAAPLIVAGTTIGLL